MFEIYQCYAWPEKNRPIDAINSRFSVVAMLQVFKSNPV